MTSALSIAASVARGRNAGKIVEADIVIDDDDDWLWYTGPPGGINQNSTVDIDFWSVFTHEAGHWVGMGHTEATLLCLDQTMYPSIDYDDADKRLLGRGDKAGISALYG